MSDNNSNGRRVGARIVRVGGVESSPPARKTPSEQDASSRSGGRARPFGAPLQQPARFQRSVQQASKIAFEQAMAEVPGATLTAPAIEAHEKASASGVLTLETNTHQEPGSAFIWEQLPELELSPQENMPRWVNNALLSPSDEEYASLGSYIAYMVDGFSVFCRMPSVEEGGNWHARLNMPHVVMPETILDVSISRLHARLRFETDHRVSRELLNRCVEKLQVQVRTALDDAREVEVTVW